MKWPIATMGFLALAAALLPGCAVTCSANANKLAALRRGMSYDETAQIMGCPGYVVTKQAPESGAFSTVEWNGPQSYFFTRTQIDFIAGKLLSYTTDRRGAL